MSTTELAPQKPKGTLHSMATRFGVSQSALLETIKSTIFSNKGSDEELQAFLIVCEQYQLNPFTKEIFAFPDKNKGIIPVVSVDGWSRIINEHPSMDGIEFHDDKDSCTCTIYRKDREHPHRITEYMSECRRNTGPWQSHPRRMLRHKALIQCARVAFGFSGIYEMDEAERIAEARTARANGRSAGRDRLRAQMESATPPDTHTTVEVVQDVAEDEPTPKTIRDEINEAFEEALAHEIWVEDAEIHAWVQERWDAPLKELSDDQLREVLDQVRVWNDEAGGGE